MNLQENIYRIKQVMGIVSEQPDDEYGTLRREFDYYASLVFENGHNGKKTEDASYFMPHYKKALANIKQYHIRQNEIKYRIPEIRQVLRDNGLTSSKGVSSGQVRGFVEQLHDTYHFTDIVEFPEMIEVRTDENKLNDIINQLNELGINVNRTRDGLRIKPSI